MSDYEEENNNKEMLGGSEEDSPEPASKRKRNRKAVTCQRCRNRKLKCDRGLPCGNCKEKGEECVWEGAIRLPVSTYTRDQEAVELRSQLDRLEGLIGMLNGQDESQTEPITFGDAKSNRIAGPSQVRVHAQDVERNSAAEALGLIAGTTSNLLSPRMSSTITIDQLQSVLPSKTELDLAVFTFLIEDMSEFPIVHRPSFRRRYSNFSAINSHNDPFFVALLLAIVGWTTHMKVEQATPSIKGGKAHTYFAASLEILNLAGYIENPSLDCVRTLFLHSHFHMVHESPSARHLLTSATQVAQSLGLNRDPTSYILSILECEERRRIWTMLVNADWISSGQTYVCYPSQYNTSLPLNANDEDISEQTISPRSLTSITPVLGLLLKSSIAAIAIRITDVCYGFGTPPSYMNIQELNGALAQIDGNLPVFEWHNGGVKPLSEVTDPVDMIRVHAHLQIRQQFIRLNRPFLTRGFADPRFAMGREKCCWAARYILAIHRGLGTDHRATRDWSLVNNTLNSLIILVIDLLQDSQGTFAEMHYNDVRSSMQIIDSLPPSARTPVVIETSKILKILIGRIAYQGEPSKKRKHDSSPPALTSGFQTDHSASNPLGSPDLAYLLSITQNPSSAFRPNTADTVKSMNPNQRVFDPALPFTRSLPLPMSIDPIEQFSLSLEFTGIEGSELVDIWRGLRKFKSMYAVPDFGEWEGLSKGVAWSGGIDLLN